MKNFKNTLHLVILVFLSTLLHAQNTLPVKEIPHWVIKKEAHSPQNIPLNDINDGIYYLDLDNQIKVDEKQPIQYYSRYAQLIVNRNGLDDSSQINITYDPSYEKLILHSVVIYRNKSRIDKTKKIKINLLKRESGLERQMYDGRMTANIILDDVRVDDIVEYSYTIIGDNPVYKNIFEYRRSVEWSVPIDFQRIRILWSRAQPLHFKELNTNIKITQRKTGKTTEYLIEQKQPQLHHTSGEVPVWFRSYGMVYFYVSDNWSDIASWSLPIYKKAYQDSTEIEKIAKSIEQTANTEEEKVIAALNYVQNNIRYLGIEMGINSHVPSNPSETLQRRYGDCKDKTVLFISLLNAMHIKANPVLVNTESQEYIKQLPPLINAFNHVIAKVTLKNKTYWLDPTRSYQADKLKYIYQPDYGYAFVVDKNTTGLEAMKNPTTLFKKSIDDYFELNTTKDKVIFKTTTKNSGYSAERLRYRMGQDSVTSLQEQYTNYYANYYSDIKALGTFQITETKGNDEIIQKEKYQINNFWTTDNKNKEYTASFYANALFSYLPKPDKPNRKVPFSLDHPIEINQKITVKFSNGKWTFDTQEKTLNNKYFRLNYTTDFNTSSNILTLNYNLKSKTDYVPAKEIKKYLKYRKDARALMEYSIVEYFKSSYSSTPKQDKNISKDNSPSKITIFIGLLYFLAFVYILESWRLDRKKKPDQSQMIYYPVSLVKMIVLHISTLGIYSLYWFYKNYQYVKRAKNNSIMPLARAIFSPIWFYPLYLTLLDDSKTRYKENRVLSMSIASIFAILYFVVSYLENKDGILSIFALLLSSLLLIPMLRYINYINKDNQENYAYNSQWQARHTLVVLLFLPLILLYS